MGTPDFAVAPLRILLDSGRDVAAVVTQPDKPRGRGENVVFSPVKVFSIERGIRVLQFDRISAEGENALREIAPDLMITAAYGQILSQKIIDVPPFGIINVHASLLPKYRGAAPIQGAVINGEKITGVTIMKTERGLDSGDILLQKAIAINDGETAGELSCRLSKLGAEALLEAVKLIESGKAVYTKQNDEAATYFKTIKKEDARIDFSKSPVGIVDFVNGMNPSPTAFFDLNGQNVKVFKAALFEEAKGLSPDSADGQIVLADAKNGLVASCGGGRAVRLCEIQFPNGKKMKDTEYLRGHSII
jgi:methionyl-tRNA formyltransferase